MEREGEVVGRRGREGEGRRRGGGEKRKGIVIGGMVIGLLMGCNNGGESAEGNLGKVIMEVGKSTEKAFYSFIELISDTLGSVRVDKETKKSQVAGYFNSLGEKLGKTSEELEKVAEKATSDSDKDGLLNKAIKEAVDTAKSTLSALKKHLESLKDIGDSGNVGEVAGDKQGKAAK
ncbi:Variable large protein 21 [Borrelia sp. HM]|nr:Variable large protein 21 [Borrelia sp. HM]